MEGPVGRQQPGEEQVKHSLGLAGITEGRLAGRQRLQSLSKEGRHAVGSIRAFLDRASGGTGRFHGGGGLHGGTDLVECPPDGRIERPGGENSDSPTQRRRGHPGGTAWRRFRGCSGDRLGDRLGSPAASTPCLIVSRSGPGRHGPRARGGRTVILAFSQAQFRGLSLVDGSPGPRFLQPPAAQPLISRPLP